MSNCHCVLIYLGDFAQGLISNNEVFTLNALEEHLRDYFGLDLADFASFSHDNVNDCHGVQFILNLAFFIFLNRRMGTLLDKAEIELLLLYDW